MCPSFSSWHFCWSRSVRCPDFSPVCSGLAAVRSWSRCSTNASVSPAYLWTYACRYASAHLAIIIPTSIRAWRAHYVRGAVDTEILKTWWLPVLAGVIAGSITARYAPERLFKIVFVMVAWSAATRLLLARATWNFGDDLPKGSLMKIYGFFVGILSTLMGVGGGLFSNLLMTFYGRPIHQAVATSSALAVLISIPGAIGYVYAGWPAAARFPEVVALQLPFALGYVSLIGAVLAMPTSLLTAPLGVRAAHAMSKRTLEMAFGCYLFIVGSRFVISLL